MGMDYGAAVMSKHTPGPWEYTGYWPDDEWEISPILYKPQGENLYQDGCFNEADAKLIAAAPALLEALEAIVSLDDSVENYQKLCDAMQSARIAISKARGES